MSGSDVALLSATALTVAIACSVFARLDRLSLIDAFLIGVGMYFGAYTIVDYYAAEQTQTAPVLVVAVFMTLWLSAASFWLYARFGPAWVVRETSFAKLEVDWVSSPGIAIATVTFVVLGLRLYTASEIGSLDGVTRQELSDLRRELPYWHTSLAMLAPGAIFAAGLAACGKAMMATRWPDRLFWTALGGVSALVALGVGRRVFLAFLVVLGCVLLKRALSAGYRWRAFAMLVLALPLMLVASNIYQVYRVMTFQGILVVGVLDVEERESIIDDALEIERTLSNLEDRRAIWLHNYELMEAYVSSPVSLQYGGLFFGEVTNYIPALVWPDKETVDTETELLRAFGLEEYDRSNNIWAFAFGDFGDFAILMVPAMVLLFVYLVAVVLHRLHDPFMRTMVMGFVLYYALNIEGGYTTPVLIARDLLLIGAIYFAAILAVRRAKWFFGVSHRAATRI